MNARKTRRRFTNEFKHDAAGLVLEQVYSRAEVGRGLGVHENNINPWVREFRAKNSLQRRTGDPEDNWEPNSGVCTRKTGALR